MAHTAARRVLAFDVYGTLIDTAGVTAALVPFVGSQEKAAQFATFWREKQLEYSFRRALMKSYVDFSVCTKHGLLYTAQRLGVHLGEADIEALMGVYKVLPAFPDAVDGVKRLQEKGFTCVAFSNGREDDVRGLLSNGQISGLFSDVVSLMDIQTYKPDPAAYAYCQQRTGGTATSDKMLISGNPFDVLGAMNAGWKGAWVQRSPANLFDPWGSVPNYLVKSLSELADTLIAEL
eukprot:comp23928_c1_seq1/m.42249 comp23928_c1_seq1/g.42249  ORF comp23928_c1_seq1/g.42249 comp23928_c1_seq1/m.42249 type:complete len:234 (-) comp23928_c1_seq1:754-1455(-)